MKFEIFRLFFEYFLTTKLNKNGWQTNNCVKFVYTVTMTTTTTLDNRFLRINY